MLALAVIATIVAAACASAGVSGPASEILKHRLPPDELARPSATPTPVPAPSPIPPLYAKLRIFVAHERDMYIARFEAGTWKPLPPLMVGVPQHVLSIAPSRPNELWFTLTNTAQADVLRVYDLETNKVTNIKVSDVHDAYFTPDESEVWSSSSGFLNKPSDRMVIYDPATKAVKTEIHFPGHYPFHTEKVDQDGVFFMADKSVMVLSDHLGPGLLWVDWRERRILGETMLGQQPFHTTYDPEGDRLLTTTNVDGMVNVIDAKTRAVVQKVAVPKAHGIGAVPIAAP